MSGPRVSVVMPVFNVECFVGAAIESILGQTLENYELIVVDDGSSDGTVGVVNQFRDSRIRLIEHSRNQGPGAARNTGIRASVGEYVAFLDGDDIAAPTRLEEQAEALDSDKELVVAGSWLEVIWEDGKPSGEMWYQDFGDGEEAAVALLFKNTIHSAIMVRKSVLPEMPFQNLPAAEDYDFAVRMARLGKLRHLQKALTQYRMRRGSRLRSTQIALPEVRHRIVTEQLAELGISPTSRELEVNRHVGAQTLPNSKFLLEEVEDWLLKLAAANQARYCYGQRDFEIVLGKQWFEVCKFASGMGWWTWNKYRASSLGRMWSPSFQQKARFAVKCAIRHKRNGGNCPPLH